jgi:hypothetical protein
MTAIYAESTRLAMKAMRAILEDLVGAPTEQAREDALAASRWFLASHCSECGDVLDEITRRSNPPGEICAACLIPIRPSGPGRSSRRGASAIDDNDVPF